MLQKLLISSYKHLIIINVLQKYHESSTSSQLLIMGIILNHQDITFFIFIKWHIELMQQGLKFEQVVTAIQTFVQNSFTFYYGAKAELVFSLAWLISNFNPCESMI